VTALAAELGITAMKKCIPLDSTQSRVEMNKECQRWVVGERDATRDGSFGAE